MGAWGCGPFENDDALDFLERLADEGLDAIRDMVGGASDEDDDEGEEDDDEYLEVDEGSMIVAAAEVVAAATGNPGRAAPPAAMTAFLQTRPDLRALRGPARAALDRVLGEDSELDELWQDSPDYDAWRRTITDLQLRLGA